VSGGGGTPTRNLGGANRVHRRRERGPSHLAPGAADCRLEGGASCAGAKGGTNTTSWVDGGGHPRGPVAARLLSGGYYGDPAVRFMGPRGGGRGRGRRRGGGTVAWSTENTQTVFHAVGRGGGDRKGGGGGDGFPPPRGTFRQPSAVRCRRRTLGTQRPWGGGGLEKSGDGLAVRGGRPKNPGTEIDRRVVGSSRQGAGWKGGFTGGEDATAETKKTILYFFFPHSFNRCLRFLFELVRRRALLYRDSVLVGCGCLCCWREGIVQRGSREGAGEIPQHFFRGDSGADT